MRGGGRSTACRTLPTKDQKGSGESFVMWYAWGGSEAWLVTHAGRALKHDATARRYYI